MCIRAFLFSYVATAAALTAGTHNLAVAQFEDGAENDPHASKRVSRAEYRLLQHKFDHLLETLQSLMSGLSQDRQMQLKRIQEIDDRFKEFGTKIETDLSEKLADIKETNKNFSDSYDKGMSDLYRRLVNFESISLDALSLGKDLSKNMPAAALAKIQVPSPLEKLQVPAPPVPRHASVAAALRPTQVQQVSPSLQDYHVSPLAPKRRTHHRYMHDDLSVDEKSKSMMRSSNSEKQPERDVDFDSSEDNSIDWPPNLVSTHPDHLAWFLQFPEVAEAVAKVKERLRQPAPLDIDDE